MIIKYDYLRSLGKKTFKKKEDRKIKTNPPEQFKSVNDENNNKKEEITTDKENNFYKINLDDIYIRIICFKLRGHSPRKFKEKKDEPSNTNKNQKENSIINTKEENKKSESSESNISKVGQNEKEKIKNDIIDFFRGECLNSIMFRILYEEGYLDTVNI